MSCRWPRRWRRWPATRPARRAWAEAGRERALERYDEAKVVARTLDLLGPRGLSGRHAARPESCHDRHRPDPPRPDLGFRQDRAGRRSPARWPARGVEILSTGGSAKAIREAGRAGDRGRRAHRLPGDPRRPGEDPAAADPRRPARPARHAPSTSAQMAAHGIAPIDLVAVNLYPFEATVARGAAFDDCVENIDIGGPAMIRAAAKNHDFVAVLTEPAQYAEVLAELAAQRAAPRWRLRRRLAGEAYRPHRRLRRRHRRMVRRAARGHLPGAARRCRRRCARSCATARTRTSRPPSTSRGSRPRRRHGAPGAGQGTVLQQPQRHRRRVRVRRRVRRPRGGDHQARQPLRRGLGGDSLAAPGRRRCAAIRSPPSAASSRSTARSTRRPPRRIAAIFTEVIVAPDATRPRGPSWRARRTCACCSPAACPTRRRRA